MAPSGPERVAAAAAALGLAVAVRRMPASTRTAEDAAAACGCDVAQIVKSLVFAVEGAAGDAPEGAGSPENAENTGGALRLLLVSGANRVDPGAVAARTGERLGRADAKRVRAATGFAIGGIPPFGHAAPVPVLMDRDLLAHGTVWAAAGAPDAVFEIAPERLREATGARVIAMS
ncbi:YbaK/EbsC family protein [Paralimibaculum aggregatum]|uniref:YbaK/EbsC family protein n=1 Tax=Paralimibaculum aggregatum TaxID=3036245 RepID=A0ABQ6LLK6_9RHOB|nr:YbaK/EbsC family protein [Limibaculum sp. NKW23]GMG81175.1 YbaK/EbsC family protein [Limibaculum sp. NKW23]